MKNVKLNKNIEKVKKLIEATIKNNGYCLCQFPKSDETRCPCKSLIEEETCICGMYEKIEEKKEDD